MKRALERTATLAIIVFFLATPLVLFAAPFSGGLIPAECQGADPSQCGFTALLQLAKNIINFIIFISIPVAAGLFTWAGYLYVSAAGNPGQVTKAHGIFQKVAIGLIIILSAWLVVQLLVTTFFNPESGAGNFLGN